MTNQTNFKYLAGVDEVGRGPVAGPVTVALVWGEVENIATVTSVIFPDKIRDSKKLSAKRREEIFTQLSTFQEQGLINFTISHGSHTQIDDIGISPTIFTAIRAMLQPLANLKNELEVRLDGSLKAPASWPYQQTIIRGDEKEVVIALASIVAKVSRDRLMVDLHRKYPVYNLAKHKGYGTKEHYLAIEKHGLSEIHRRSFLKRVL